jgi:hypothetical protein
MAEIRSLVAADTRRWNELGEMWHELSANEQEIMLRLARLFLLPEPQSLKA